MKKNDPHPPKTAVAKRLEQHPELRQQKPVAEAVIQAQQDERARIGHELHDNVNQILTSAYLYLTVLDKENPDFDKIRDRVMEILTLGIEEIRRLSTDMVLPDLKKEGLTGSVRNLVEDINACKLFNTHFTHSEIPGIEAINPHLKITLFRIIQEQVKNIIKYSQAKNIEISLFNRDSEFHLQITDDGVGFDPRLAKPGLGLSSIRERTDLYNGQVILDSTPGRGCSLTVNIPFTP